MRRDGGQGGQVGRADPREQVLGTGGTRGPSWQRVWASGPSATAERGRDGGARRRAAAPRGQFQGAGQVETGPGYLG